MKGGKGIRDLYSEMGVEGYYSLHGSEYANPHVEQVRELLHRNAHRIDYSHVLDFCCGGGEVSLVLRELGFDTAQGCDPYTATLFEANLGRTCLPYSFQDVIQGKLTGEYSSVICSFAMHLCPEKQLYPLAQALFRVAPQIVIITPHKRPELEKLSGVSLEFEDFALTERGKKVRMKAFKKH
ncbi:MAG: class I SAM-dependent methyltransferase [Saprospiraceae bacterium]